MSSAVHYKFRSAKQYGAVNFEGDFIQLAELKVAIVEQEKLQFGEDFDLHVVDAQTQEEYHDENALIPKNTSVIVKRVPAGSRDGRGGRMGVLSQIAMAKKNERFAEIVGLSSASGRSSGVIAAARQILSGKLALPPGADAAGVAPAPTRLRVGDEQTRLASVVNTAGVGDRSAGVARSAGGRGGRPGSGAGGADGPPPGTQPPPGYVCHRCGESGHYIQHCPASADSDLSVIRVKRPTGIPRSMLKTIDAPQEGGTELQLPGGKFVTLAADEREFTKEPLAVRMARLAEARAAAAAAASEPGEEASRRTRVAEGTTVSTVTREANRRQARADKASRSDQRENAALPPGVRADLPYFPLPDAGQYPHFFGEGAAPTPAEFQEVTWAIVMMHCPAFQGMTEANTAKATLSTEQARKEEPPGEEAEMPLADVQTEPRVNRTPTVERSGKPSSAMPQPAAAPHKGPARDDASTAQRMPRPTAERHPKRMPPSGGRAGRPNRAPEGPREAVSKRPRLERNGAATSNATAPANSPASSPPARPSVFDRLGPMPAPPAASSASTPPKVRAPPPSRRSQPPHAGGGGGGGGGGRGPHHRRPPPRSRP